MSTPFLPPPPTGRDWQNWAERINSWLTVTKDKLTFKLSKHVASDNGVMLWDETLKSPVISVDGAYRQLILKDGHGIAVSNTDISPLAVNTAYPIAWDAINLADGVSIGSPASRLVFSSGGTFMLSFSVQITSGDASTKTLWFWPRINGVDIPNSTMKVSIHNNSETTVLSRTSMFDISAGDYIEAVYESSSTAVTLESAPAGVNAPATPSVVLSVTRIHQ